MNKIRLFALLILSIALLTTSCQKDEDPIINPLLPTLSTAIVSNITADSALCGGSIISNGDLAVLSRGVCWSTSPNPTIVNSKTSDSLENTSFKSRISGLSENTNYYVRAYAITANGTAYGNEVNFKTNTIKKELFKKMLAWMCGSFSSHNHADTTVNQYSVDVRFHMNQIWADRDSTGNIYWLYVEQAYASSPNSPYRQRIYKIMIDAAGNIYDEIYAIPGASTYLHGYDNPSVFNNLNASTLTIKDGCNVNFQWIENGQYFKGNTESNNCLANGVPGVSYITSDATIHSNYMTSWDKGYSSSAVWVMGPDWPYIFDKIDTYPFVSFK
jgi:hypothetical protein